MRLAPLIILTIMGLLIIVIRNLYAKIIAAAAVQVPALAKYEKYILRILPIIGIVVGVAFIVVGILMGLNLIFPDVGPKQ